MLKNLFPDFLVDPEQYGLAERYWVSLWNRIDLSHRTRYQWTHPWLGTGSLSIQDGNPIFSAYSPRIRRGIRVIQEEPIGSGLEIQVWLDTFGGDITDPDHIHELVISCVLSDVAAEIALTFMAPWVQAQSISLEYDAAGRFLPRDPLRMIRSFGSAA